MVEIVNQISRPADISSQRSNRLRQRSHLHIHAVRAVEVVNRASPVPAQNSRGMRVIDHHQRPIPICKIAELIDGTDVSIHRKNTVRNNQLAAGFFLNLSQQLLAMGTDPNALPGDDHQGPTRPLILVRSAAAARALIDAGADASAADQYGQTAMKMAASLQPQIAEVLLNAGAPVDGPVDRDGSTALMRAAAAGNLGVVRLLVSAGADPGYPGPNGTALDCARQAKEFERSLSLRLEGVTTAPFVPDFDGVIAALERALTLRQR